MGFNVVNIQLDINNFAGHVNGHIFLQTHFDGRVRHAHLATGHVLEFEIHTIQLVALVALAEFIECGFKCLISLHFHHALDPRPVILRPLKRDFKHVGHLTFFW